MPDYIPSSAEYECTDCKDREFLYKEHGGDWVAVPCHCRPKKRMRRLIRASGLTEMLRKKTFDNFKPKPKQQEMYRVATDFAKNYPNIKNKRCNGLAYTGTVGTGKTHLLAAIANFLLSKGISVCFVNTPSFISELRRSQFEEGRIDEQVDAISNIEVVVFDDLAKEKSTEWVQNQYYKIVNHRYINNLPTLFSTNSNMEELEEKLGDATASRLYAMTKDRLIHIVDEDHRIIE